MAEPIQRVASATLLGEHDDASTYYSSSPRRQWSLAVVLLIVSTLAAIDRQVISLLVNPIRDHLQISDTQISLVIGAAFAIANTLFTLPAGYLADRVSRRGLIAGGAIVWSIMTMACGAAGSFVQLFAARAGLGLSESVIQPCSLSMLRAALSPERRARGFAVHAMALMGGSALALIVGGALIGAIEASGIDRIPLFGAVQPWQLTLIIIGVVGLPAAGLLFTVREPPRSTEPGARASVSYRHALSLIGARWKVYVPLLVFQLGLTMVNMAYATWLAAMIGRVWHLSYLQIGLSLGLMMLVLPPIGLWVAGQLMDFATQRLGVRGPVFVGLFFTSFVAIAATAAPLAPTLSSFWIWIGALLSVSATVFPITATVTASITPTESMGKVSALQLFLNGLIAAVAGPTVVALVSDTFFSGPRALADAISLVCGVYSIVALAGLGVVYRTLKSTKAVPH